MFDWLKKLGGGKPWQNKAGLDENSVSLLAEDFSVLEKMGADVPSDVLQYALDGAGDEILTKLAGTQAAGDLLKMPGLGSGLRPRGETVRMRFFDSVLCADPGFFSRLGKIYEAATRFKRTGLVSQHPHLAGHVSPTVFQDPRLDWLQALLGEAYYLNLNMWPRTCRPCSALNADMVEALLKSEGHPPSLLSRAAFLPPLPRFGNPPFEMIFETMPGFGEWSARNKGGVIEALDNPDFKQRLYALGLMKSCKVPLEPFAETLTSLAVSSSKQVRDMAALLLIEISAAARPFLEHKLASGENDERANAAALLWHWEGEKIRALLEQRLADEKNKKVVQKIRDLLGASAATASATQTANYETLELPALPPIPDLVPLSAETEQAWHDCFALINIVIGTIPTNRPAHHAPAPKAIPTGVIKRAFADLQRGGEAEPLLDDLFRAGPRKEYIAQINSFWQRPEIQPVHFVRFMIQLGALKSNTEHDKRFLTYGFWFETLLPVFQRAHPETGLRELAAAFTATGLDAKRIGRGELSRFFGRGIAKRIPKARVWPYWAENLELLEEAFAPNTGGFMERYYQRSARENAFEVLATFPTPPARLLPLLWNLALGPKSERPAAQRCLEGAHDKFERLVAALEGGSADSRFAAAEWLGRLADKRATEPLLAALKKEKNEATKGCMMSALELLGAPVEQFLDRAGLLKEAKKNVAKDLPEDLKWFPFDLLPVAHWQDTGAELDPDIVKWWLIQGFKLKNPEPGALLRRYCASLKSSEREDLGIFILEAWLAEDTAPIARADAEKAARAEAKSTAHYAQYFYQQHKNNPQMAATAKPPLSEEEYYAQLLPAKLKQPKGSAIASKGILSVAGACVGGAAAPVVNRYLREWYGQRSAQCRAMLQMLAWVEHRTATQLLLAVGSRFRTKGIQEEANKQAQALAERKGWTVAELADRTIPSAGLDENGVMTIDYGPRQFTAKLNEETEFALTDAEGKVLKTLPDPRKDDDEAKADEAKKGFSAAKKELKSVVTMQRDRLYEAMCTQREWPFEDWNLYLNQHPIVRHLCQQVVWAVVRDGKTAQLFRPLPDSSLTDEKDDPVKPGEKDFIRVAHECQVSPAQSQAWRGHLKDYDVETLFEQFGRQNFNLTEDKQNEAEIADFQGHLVETYKLRGRANKLGYSRGQAQDGGWFFDYHKRFPTLGIEAVIEFTGNGLPEENRTVALTNLHFLRASTGNDSDGGGEKMMLSEIPAVLLSECWNDIRQVAAEGPGFDADWEKKSQF